MTSLLANLIDGITKNQAVQGHIFAAVQDIFVAKSCKDVGYTELKYASEGDILEVIEIDTLDPTMVRVFNRDNSEEVEYVPLTDLEEL